MNDPRDNRYARPALEKYRMIWLIALIAAFMVFVVGFLTGFIFSSAKTGSALAAAMLDSGMDEEEANAIIARMKEKLQKPGKKVSS